MKKLGKFLWRNVGLITLILLILVPIKGMAQQQGADSFRLDFATSVAGGGWMTIGEGLAEAIRREFPKSVITVLPSVAPENPVRTHIGDVDLSISEVTTVLQAMHGEPPYKTKSDKLRAIAGIFDGKYNFVITEATGIRSIADIRDKKYPLRFSTHKKGTLFEMLNMAIFEGYGFKFEDIEKWGGRIYHLGMPQSCEMIKDKNLDASAGTMTIPHASIVDLGTVRRVRLLPIDDHVAKLVNNKYGTTRCVIPANTYTFQNEDIPTICSIVLMITSSDLPDDVAYSLAKALHKQIDYLRGFHQTLKEASGKSLVKVSDVPIHPGAKRYYREAGLIKD